MRPNFLVYALVALIGVVFGISLLFGIGTVVQTSMIPLADRVNQVINRQSVIETKLAKIESSLEALDKKMDGALAKVANANRPPVPEAPTEDLNKVYDIPVGNSVVIGKKDAPVTIVKFTDLQCPFCHRFYPGIKQALEIYPDQVRLIVKHFPLPFHPNALPAAKLALAANEQGKYKEMIEALLASGADVSEPKVKEYAKQMGINVDRLQADLKKNDAQYQKIVEDDLQLVSQVDVRGTPTIFINGKKSTARTFDGYKAEIDKILAGQK